jgi:hypothetical protein
LVRLIIDFSPIDGLEHSGKLLIQTNPLKQVHIIDTSLSKLSMVEGLVLLHLLSGVTLDGGGTCTSPSPQWCRWRCRFYS